MPGGDSMQDVLNSVHDRQTFLDFVRRLRSDWLDHSSEWENITIDSFLESAIAWAEDSAFGRTQGLTDSEPWRQFAVFLMAGKRYE